MSETCRFELDQFFDAIEHRVEILREFVPLVSGPPQGYPLMQAGLDDPAAGRVDCLDPRHGTSRGGNAGRRRQQQEQPAGPAEADRHHLAEVSEIVRLSTDKKMEAVRQGSIAGAQRGRLAWVPIFDYGVEIGPAPAPAQARRPSRQVSRDATERRVGEQVNPIVKEAVLQPPVDHRGQPVSSSGVIGFAEGRVLRRDRAIRALGDIDTGAPVNISEYCKYRRGKPRHVNEG